MLWHVTAKAAAYLRAAASLLTALAHNSVNHTECALACGRCTVPPLPHEGMADSLCILSAACVALQVRRDNWKYQSGLLPESQGADAIQAARWQCTPCCTALLALPMRVALPCRPVAVCRKGLLGDEQAAHFTLENGVLEWKMAQSGASGGAAPGRGA